MNQRRGIAVSVASNRARLEMAGYVLDPAGETWSHPLVDRMLDAGIADGMTEDQLSRWIVVGLQRHPPLRHEAMRDPWPPALRAKADRLMRSRFHYRPATDDFACVDDAAIVEVITRTELEAMTEAELDNRVPPVAPTGLGIGFRR